MRPTRVPPGRTRRRWAAAVCVAVASCLGAGAVRGDDATDEVHRVGGGVVRGELAELSPGGVRITTQSGSSTRIPIEDVRLVRFAHEPAALSDARSLLLRRDGAAALKEIATLTESDRATATRNMLVDVAYVRAAAAGRVAIATGAGLDEAARGLRDFVATNARSHHLHAANETLGDVLARAGRYAEAGTAYGELAKGPPAIAARGAALRAELQVMQGSPAAAIREYEAAAAAAAEITGEAGRQAGLIAALGRARCQVLLHAPEDAIETCRGVIGACRADDASSLSRAYLVLGEAQSATGTRDREAVVSLLTVDLVHNTVPEDRAEALHHLIGLWERLNHPERARETRAALETGFPNSPWTRKPAAAEPS